MYCKSPKSNILSKLVTCTLILLGTFSCHSNKKVLSSTKKESIKPSQIVFLNYAIKKEEINEKTIVKFLNSKQVEGQLKNKNGHIENKGIYGDIICAQINTKSEIIAEILITNPLKKALEYIDESKNFKSALIELDSTKFSVRLQLYPETRFVKLSKINLDNSLQELILTKRKDL